MDATAADELLRSAESARRKTRRARRALWLPPLIFGLVVLGATPLYHPVAEPPGSAIVCTGNVQTGITGPSGPIATITHTVHRASPLDFVGGLSLPNNGHDASLYWLIALPLGYALTAVLFYRRTKNRGG